MSIATEPAPRTDRAATRLPVRVLGARWEAEGIASYELTTADGSALPAWEPGAHVDVHLPSGTIRQYSLCGDPASTSCYRIAVLELPDGRGGSLEVHRELRPGVRLEVGAPRQEFALVEAERYLFLAGGIGITPMLPMIREAQRRGADWRLVYGVRSAEHVAFRDELAAYGDRVETVVGILDLPALVAGSGGAAVYACGPTAMLDALTDAMEEAGRAEDLHLERFAPAAPVVVAGDGEPADGFEVELAKSGVVIKVGPDETVLDAIRAAGVDRSSSCEMGFCGACETPVLEGVVDHRDDLLTEDERAANNTMLVCVSRAACARLKLDL